MNCTKTSSVWTRALAGVVVAGGLMAAGGSACRAQEAAAPAASQATSRPVRKAHDPKSFEKEIAKYEEADKQAMPAGGGVVFVGSSSIRIWDVKKAFPDANVINRGFGGSWSCDSVYYADRIVIPYKPKTIIFYAGDNDIAGGQTAGEVAGCFEAFVKKVRAALPEVRVVFITVKPSLSRWKLWPEMEKANALVKAYAGTQKGVEVVDVTAPMLGEDGKPKKELFRQDGLHMSDQGYAIWNEMVRGIVEGK